MTPPPHFKLNILALPRQTTLLLGVMVVTLLGIVLVGTVGLAPFPTWPLAMALLLLPLRAFLARPEQEITRRQLLPAGDDLAGLRQAVAAASQSIGLRHTPALLICPGERLKQPYIFGTFRHWYLAVGQAQAVTWQQQLVGPTAPVVEAKLIHELYHFKAGDYWQVGYARELLRLTAWFMVWALLLFLGYGLLLLAAGPAIVQTDPAEWLTQIDELTPEMRQVLEPLFPAPADMAEIRQKAASLNVGIVINFAISAVLPYIFVGFLLWLLLWPRLWRTREFYADAGVVQTQRHSRPFLAALTNIPLPFLKNYSPPQPVPQKQTTLRAKTAAWRKAIARLTHKHPPTVARLAAINQPERVFGSWQKTALLVGGFVLLLDLVSVSSLALFYVGSWPMHFPTLVIFLIVALNLIPSLVMDRSAWSEMLKIVAVVMGLRLLEIAGVIMLLLLLFIVNPAGLANLLTASAATAAGFSRQMSTAEYDALTFKTEDATTFVITGAVVNLAQVFIIFIILVAALGIVIFLLRRLLTWYGLPHAKRRLMAATYAVIGVMAWLVGLTALPLVTTVLLRPAELLDISLLGVGVLGLLPALIGWGWFIILDGHYAQRCPACGETIPGPFQLGKTCGCGHRLHPWLIAEYDG